VFTSKFVGTGPLSYKKRIYRAAVSQRLRNTALEGSVSFLQQASQNTEKFRSNKNADHCYNFKYM